MYLYFASLIIINIKKKKNYCNVNNINFIKKKL